MINQSKPMTSSECFEQFILTQLTLEEKRQMLQSSRREADRKGAQVKQEARQLGFSTLAEKLAWVRSRMAPYHQKMRDAEDTVAEASRVSDEAWASYERSRGL